MSTAITDASVTALTVAASGTNYGLQVDESAASAATGLRITAAAAGSGLAVSTISSGTNENLTIDARGTGTVTIGGTSSGNVKLAAGTAVDISGSDGRVGFASSVSYTTSVAWIFNSTHTNGNVLGVYKNGTRHLELGAATAIGVGSGTDSIIRAINGHLYLESGVDEVRSTTIYQAGAADSPNVFVQSDGTLGRSTSSVRYKSNVERLTDWRWLLDLTPVTFASKKEPNGRRFGGLLAEDVAEKGPRHTDGYPLFAVLDAANQPDEVAYAHLAAPMIKAIQELNSSLETATRRIDELVNRVQELEATVAG